MLSGNRQLGLYEDRDQGVAVILALRNDIRAADRAVMQTYLRLLTVHWGIIVNFGKKHLDVKIAQSSKK